MLNKIKNNSVFFLAMMFFLAILLMSVGYATINTITIEIEGAAEAEQPTDVFIYDVTNVAGSGASAEIVNYINTTMHSVVTLSSGGSYITECVKVKNNTNKTYYFKEVLYDSNYYSNQGITFEISNFNIGDIINSGESKDIYITFKYVNGTAASSNVLDSYLNFHMSDILPMTVKGTSCSLTYTGKEISEGASVEVTEPTSGYTIKYGITAGNYNLNKMPGFVNVGIHTVYYQVTADSYETYTGELTITITKANSTYTKEPTSKTLEYNESAQALVNAGTTSSGTIQYKLSGGSYSTSIPTATNVGTYTVYYKIVGDSNHNDYAEKSISVTISAPPTYSITYTTGYFPYTPSSGKTSYNKLSTITLDSPTATGFTFSGWYDNSSCTGTAITQISKGTTGNLQLWAKWKFVGFQAINYITSGSNYVLAPSISGTTVTILKDGTVWPGEGTVNNFATAPVVAVNGQNYIVTTDSSTIWKITENSSGKYVIYDQENKSLWENANKYLDHDSTSINDKDRWYFDTGRGFQNVYWDNVINKNDYYLAFDGNYFDTWKREKIQQNVWPYVQVEINQSY